VKLLSSESGNALVEFALILPIFTFIVLGVVNYSLRIQSGTQLAEAANAGAAFGSIPGNLANINGMKNAAKAAAPGVAGLTAVASQVWTCTPGGSAVASSSTCSGYGTPIQYVEVTTSASVPALFSWPGLSSTLTLTETVYFRVPWTI
jgi:Flp pilus assembly protein TadG